jgi:hypothetical protein
LLKECNEAKFGLLEKGPSVLNVKGMEERLEDIWSEQISHNATDKVRKTELDLHE